MNESNVQPFNQDPLINKLNGLRFEVVSVNHQLETLTDFLKSKGDLNSEITDLLLKVHFRQTVIEDNLSNFSGSHKDVSKLRELVAEFISLKNEVLAAASRLGYEVEVEIGAKKGKETQKMKVARAEKEVEDLADVFRGNFNRNPYEELPFQQARKALAAIKNNNNVIETDYRIRALNKRAYYKSLAKTIGEIKEFFRLKKISFPGDVDISKQVVEGAQSVDTATLIELYRNTNSSAFKTTDPNGVERFKSLGEITADINDVLEHYGFDKDRIDVFYNECLKPAKIKIAELSSTVNSSDSSESEKEEARINRQKVYDEILVAVSAAITVPVVTSTEGEKTPSASAEPLEEVENQEVDSPLPSAGVEGKKYDLTLDEIKAELSICTIEFEQLRTKFTEKFGEEIAREQLSAVQEILDLISNEKEDDLPSLQGRLTELIQGLSWAEEQFNILARKAGVPDVNLPLSSDSSVQEQKTKPSPEDVQNWYNLYRAADSSVFEDPVQVGKFKPFSENRAQIREVLEYVGLAKDEINVFMAPIEVDLHDQIKKLNLLQDGDMIKSEYAKTLVVLKRQIAKKYQDLLNEVATKIKEVESGKSALKPPATPEEIKTLLSTVKTFDQLAIVLNKLDSDGVQIQGSRKKYLATELMSQIERMREEVKTLIKTHPEIDKSAIVEMTFHPHHPKFSKLTNVGGLRDLVKRLVEEEIETTDAVNVSVVAAPDSVTPEYAEKPFSAVKTFEELNRVLLGENLTEDGLALLKSQIEKVRDEVKVKKESDGDEWDYDVDYDLAIKSRSYIAKAALRIMNYGGLRDAVIRLVEEENGIFVETDESTGMATPDTDLAAPKTVLKRDHENSMHRLELFARKDTYQKKQVEYEAALKKYYEESWFGKFRQAEKGIKNFFGLSMELPPNLMALKRESQSLRLEYAKAMDAVLVSRANSREANKTYTLDADLTKKAFVEHFILRPNEYSLNLQKEKLTPEARSAFMKIVGFVGKTAKENKWKIRAGTIALASLAGLATGGVATMVAGGTLKLGKILASAKAGTVVAGATNSLMQMRTKSAAQNLDQEVKKFSLDNMQDSETAIVKAKRVAVSKEQQQAAATMAAGIIAGGLAGYEIGGANAEILREISHSQPGIPENPAQSTAETPEVKPDVEKSTAPQVGGEAQSAALTEKSLETLIGEPLKLNDLQIANEGLNKEYGATAIKNVRLMGAFDDVELTTEEQARINDLIQRESQILAVKPNISEMVFEKYLFLRMSEQFRQEDWWIGAQPKGIDLDLSRIDASLQSDVISDHGTEGVNTNVETDSIKSDVIFVDKEAASGVPESVKGGEVAGSATEPVDTPAAKPEVGNENTYTVQRGDTLSEIVAEHFKEELKNVPPDQYNQVLYKVLDNIEASDELKNSLGIKSGDIDLIYPNEELNLNAVGEELKRVLEAKPDVSVSAEGVEGVDLDADKGVSTEINSDNLPAAANDSGWRGYEATPEQKFEAIGNPEILPPSGLAPVEGQYFNQSAWREYINQHFGSEAAFNRAVTAEVDYIDSIKSNWFDRLIGVTVYDSPYDVMKNMTVEELAELREEPNSERSFCEKHHLKYETYRDWQDWVAILKANYEWKENTTWADLFKRHVAEVKAPILNKPVN